MEKTTLTPLQYHVTQKNGTERPFDNEYWDNKKEGIYVDIVSGKALFSSTNKFDSGTGWPSFTKPIEDTAVTNKVDTSHGMERVEVRSSEADSHLGHVFDDGPLEEGGKRFCINSAALKFIPKEDLANQGYGQYLPIFDEPAKEVAIIAGGCFWGVEKLFSDLKGVINAENGYTGGYLDNPIYEVVSLGISGHAEAVRVTFDPKIISYEEILRFFFTIHDPTTKNQQGNDIGSHYRSEIFYLTEAQRLVAEKVIKQANAKVFEGKITTEITKASKFFLAEKYHQDYLDKNPNGYTCHHQRPEWEF